MSPSGTFARIISLGNKKGEIKYNKFLDPTEIKNGEGKRGWYLRKNPWSDRVDVKTMDGQKAGEVTYDPWLDRLEFKEVK